MSHHTNGTNHGAGHGNSHGNGGGDIGTRPATGPYDWSRTDQIDPDPFFLLEVRHVLDELAADEQTAPPRLRFSDGRGALATGDGVYTDGTVWIDRSLADVSPAARAWLLRRALIQTIFPAPAPLRITPWILHGITRIVGIFLVFWVIGPSGPIDAFHWLPIGATCAAPAVAALAYVLTRSVAAYQWRVHEAAIDRATNLADGIHLTRQIATELAERDPVRAWHPWRTTPTWSWRITTAPTHQPRATSPRRDDQRGGAA